MLKKSIQKFVKFTLGTLATLSGMTGLTSCGENLTPPTWSDPNCCNVFKDMEDYLGFHECLAEFAKHQDCSQISFPDLPTYYGPVPTPESPECCKPFLDEGDEITFEACVSYYTQMGTCFNEEDIPNVPLYGAPVPDPVPEPEPEPKPEPEPGPDPNPGPNFPKPSDTCTAGDKPYCMKTSEGIKGVTCVNDTLNIQDCDCGCEAYMNELKCDQCYAIYGPPPPEIGDPCFESGDAYCDVWRNAVYCKNGLVIKYDTDCYGGCLDESAGKVSCPKKEDFTAQELECCKLYSGATPIDPEGGFFQQCVEDLRKTGICQSTPIRNN